MTTLIDAFATTPWYIDHVAPIWAALGDRAARFYVRDRGGAEHAKALQGVVVGMPTGTGPLVTVSYGDHVTARRMGRKRLILGQHGAGQSYLVNGVPHTNPSYPGGIHQEDVGLFLVPNETAAKWTRWRYPKARIAVVGCPKLDTLPHRVPDGRTNVIALSAHWDGIVVPEAASAWSHFARALAALATTHTVIGHGHPRMIHRLAPLYRVAGIEVVPSFEDVCRRADLYITDNSSSLFEFAATGRPVIVLNSPRYRRAVNHGLRFWDASCVGINVNKPDELPDAVARALERWPADVAEREAALGLVYQPRSGGSRLAADAILDYADGT